MPESKPAETLPDDPMAETFEQWETESTDRARKFVNTPGHELEAERRRQEEIQHKARIAREEELARIEVRQGHEMSKQKPTVKRALTVEQLRTKKIRGLLCSQFDSRPDPDTYGEWMDRAGINPPKVCARRYKTYKESLAGPEKFRKAVRTELSQLWTSRNKK